MKIELFYGGLLVLSLLLSSCEKPNYYTVRFFSKGELLYTSEVLEGENAIYYGNKPTKKPELDGDYIISYAFSGWDKNTYGLPPKKAAPEFQYQNPFGMFESASKSVR